MLLGVEMARDRSKDEILDQVMYAIQSVTHHYGPNFRPEGLKEIRDYLNNSYDFWCDANWRVDVLEGGIDGNPDFCPKVLNYENTGLDFEEVVKYSRTGDY
jgi:hypothetical protein